MGRGKAGDPHYKWRRDLRGGGGGREDKGRGGGEKHFIICNLFHYIDLLPLHGPGLCRAVVLIVSFRAPRPESQTGDEGMKSLGKWVTPEGAGPRQGWAAGARMDDLRRAL